MNNNLPGNNSGNGQQGDPFNNWPNNNQADVLPHDSEEDRERLKQWMYNKLYNHRVSCATKIPYDTRLDNRYTPQEHEYICDLVVKSGHMG